MYPRVYPDRRLIRMAIALAALPGCSEDRAQAAFESGMLCLAVVVAIAAAVTIHDERRRRRGELCPWCRPVEDRDFREPTCQRHREGHERLVRGSGLR